MNRKHIQPAFALVLSLVSVQAHADVSDTMAVKNAHQQKALILAQILNSDAIMIGDDKSDVKAEKLMLELLEGNAEFAALEAEYPGIGSDIARAVLPVINKYSRTRLPELHKRQSALYRRNFSESEIDRLVEFYASPTGQKLISSLIENMQPTEMMKEAKASENFEMSAVSALKDLRKTVPAVLEDMNDEDTTVLEKFGRSGLLGRMKAMAIETQSIGIEWMNESAPGEDEEIEVAITAVVDKRIGKTSQ